MSFITYVDKNNFESEVLKSDKMVLIDFYATWCGPCKMLARVLEKFAEENQDKVKVVKIDVDQSPELAEAFGIKSMPTLVTMKDGQALLGRVGAVPKNVVQDLVDQSFQITDGKPAANNPTGNKNTDRGPKL